MTCRRLSLSAPNDARRAVAVLMTSGVDAAPARLLLAVLLAFGGETLLWPHAPGRGPLDWLAAAVGYLTLGVMLPDLMQRYRVRDAIGLLALAGLTALATGVLLYPQSALADVPLTLISRVLGAQTAAALAMLVLWLTLLRGRLNAGFFILALVAGIAWGLLGRWFPQALDPAAGETPLGLVLAAGVVGITLIALTWTVVARSAPHADDLLLSRRGWALALLILAALLGLRAAQGWLDVTALAITATLGAFMWLILRLYRRMRIPGLLQAALPPRPVNPRFLALAVIFLLAGVFGWLLPRPAGDADPLGILGALLIAFGAAWLPSLSLVVGGRALIREIRAQQL